MNIAAYISKLLYFTDCVIVPGLGGFVTNYASAKIHPTTHAFTPPSKSILFNSKLINDDGFLIHFISQNDKISYAQAKLEINYFVEEMKFELDQGKAVVFENVGELNKTSDGSFSFSPDRTVNYLEESYGFSSFISPPIARQSMHKRLEKKFIDRKPVPDSEIKDRKVYWAYVTIIPIVLIVGWFVFMNGYNNKNTQESSVLSIGDPTIEHTETIDLPNEKNESEKQPLKDSNFSDTAPIPNKEIKETMEFSIPKSNTTVQLNYYIIGGAFQYKPNADKLIGTLRSSGYNATHAGLNPNGLYLVSYFNSEDKSEALANLNLIRKESNPSAWLLKK